MYFVPNETQPDQTIIKAVVLGNTEVGKTSLCNRFYLKKWDPLTAPTISASCLRTEIHLLNQNVQFCIWDTAGQERFKSITPLYYRGSHVAILVVDLTVAQSLDIAADWIKELKEHGPPNIPFIIFGNKSDLKDKLALSTKSMNDFAQNHNAEYLQVSALTGQHVDEAFNKAALLGFNYYRQNNISIQDVPLNEENEGNKDKDKKSKCGC